MKDLDTTQYLKLAKKIANSIEIGWFCCLDLKHPRQFTKLFRPTNHELNIYNHDHVVWMSELGVKRKHKNNFRILALLFMHEMTINP